MKSPKSTTSGVQMSPLSKKLLLITLSVSLVMAFFGNHAGTTIAYEMSSSPFILSAERINALVQACFIKGPLHGITRFWELGISPYSLMCSMLGFIFPWIIWLSLQSLLSSKKERSGEEHGSSRWATKKEILPYTFEKNDDPDNAIALSAHAGIALSRKGFVQRYDRNPNVLVVGGSGSGKTRYFVKPNLMRCYGNYLVSDPKGTLLPDVGKMLEHEGYTIVNFDTNIFERSLVYNPLAYVKTDLEVEQFVDNWLEILARGMNKNGDPFWDDAAKTLLYALVAYLRDWAHPSENHLGGLSKLLDMAKVKENDPDYVSPLDSLFLEIETGYVRTKTSPTIPDPRARGVASGSPNTKGQLSVRTNRTTSARPGQPRMDSSGNTYYGLRPEEDMALNLYKKFKSAAGKTTKSILITVNTKLRHLVTSEVKSILCGEDEMHLERLADPNCKIAVFDTFQDTNATTLGWIHGLLVYQAISLVCHIADEGEGKLKRPVQFILDEFYSMGLPSNVAQMISVVRSRNVGICTMLQSIKQLNELYNDNIASIFMGCCDTRLYLGGSDDKTTELISSMVGKQTIHTTTQTVNKGSSSQAGSWSETEQMFERCLLDASEALKLDADACVVLIRGEQPFLDKKCLPESHHRWNLMDPGESWRTGADCIFDKKFDPQSLKPRRENSQKTSWQRSQELIRSLKNADPELLTPLAATTDCGKASEKERTTNHDRNL